MSDAARRPRSWPLARLEPLASPPTRPAHLDAKKLYILRVCRALLIYGAPSHRIEDYIQRTARILEIDLQVFYLPNCTIISFDNGSGCSADVQIITSSPSLNLAKLSDVHQIYKNVTHGQTSVKEATAELDCLIARKDRHPTWLRILAYGLASAFIGPVSYGARPIDLPFIFLLGTLVGLVELVLVAKSALFGYLFEMLAAIVVSFVARGLGSIDGGLFCFSALAQASLVMILPGFLVTSASLELQSRMMISGAARLVYGVIYTLFLAFGYTVGITIYGAIDPNATVSTQCRNSWPFWWQVIFVIPFAGCYAVVQNAKWSQIPAAVCITIAGWLVEHFSAREFAAVQSFPNALASLTVGILSNLYSRLLHGFATAAMHPAIFILVPGSFAASGSLLDGLAVSKEVASGGSDASSSQFLALRAGYTMVEIAIGIAAGLSVSALLVYPLRERHSGGGLFSY